MLLLTITLCAAGAAAMLVLASLTTRDGRSAMLDQYEQRLAEVREKAAEKAAEEAAKREQMRQQEEMQRLRRERAASQSQSASNQVSK